VRQLQLHTREPSSMVPQIEPCHLCHCFWLISLTAKWTKRDLTHVLNNICQRFDPIAHDPQSTQHSLSSNLQIAQKALCKAKWDADQLQHHHLETALNAAKASNQKQRKAKNSCILLEWKRTNTATTHFVSTQNQSLLEASRTSQNSWISTRPQPWLWTQMKWMTRYLNTVMNILQKQKDPHLW